MHADPRVRMEVHLNVGKYHAKPAKDDPRRCECRKRRPGPDGDKRCQNWKKTGRKFCEHHDTMYHGQRGQTALGPVDKTNRSRQRMVGRLPKVYSEHLSKSLAERVDGARSVGLDLGEELALVRVCALDAVMMYDAVEMASKVDARDGSPLPLETQLQCRVAAGQIVRDAAAEVASMAEKAAKVAESRQNMLSGTALAAVLADVIHAAHRTFGDDQPDKVREFARAIRDIRPLGGHTGTTITPDQDALAMDATVPAGPPQPTETQS